MPALAVENMLDLIGGTPLVRLRHLVDPAMADVFCKCEQFNPGGSVKDRIALAMIEAAEREGRITPGRVGDRRADLGQHRHRAWRWSARVKGYRLILTMPDNMSLERRALLQGLRRRAAPHAGGAGHGGRGRARARSSAARTRTRFMPQQFKNPANPEVHRRTTGARDPRAARQPRPRRVRRRRRHGRHHHRRRPGAARASARDVRIVAVEPAKSAGAVGRPAGRAPHPRHRRRLRARDPQPLGDRPRCARSPSATRSEIKLAAGPARGAAGRHLGGRGGEDRAATSRASSARARRS